VLLIHGFMAAPYEVRQWADDFFSRGYTVYAPGLPVMGHRRQILRVKIMETGLIRWKGGTKFSPVRQTDHCSWFSTGAGLALHQAICHPHRYKP